MTDDRLYTHVLVPTDFRPECRAAYQVALATARGSGATVSLLHVVPPPVEEEFRGLDAIRLMHHSSGWAGPRARPPLNTADEDAALLDRLRAVIPPAWVGTVRLRLEVRRGDVAAEIAQYVADAKVDLIVTAGARPGFLPAIGRTFADRLAQEVASVEVVRVTPRVPA